MKLLILMAVGLSIGACEDIGTLYTLHKYRGAAVSLYDGPSFSDWMLSVKRIAKSRDDGITGDEKYFREYYRNGFTPVEAIYHWENDPWPNMGGGS